MDRIPPREAPIRIKGSIAVVTGASSGIGEAVALELARRGATVASIARRSELLSAVTESCRRDSPASTYHVADVSSRAACDEAAAAILAEHGRVDILVNNAGISMRKLAHEMTVEEIERVMSVNFFGAVYMTSAFLPQMIGRKHGSIVNVTSVAGYLPNPRESAYTASKAALSGWTHSLAVDLRPFGVHAGVVSPGPIATDIWALDGDPQNYRGKMYPPSRVALATAALIERERTHITIPRHFGLPPAMYPIFGRPMRWGLRRYDSRAQRRPPLS